MAREETAYRHEAATELRDTLGVTIMITNAGDDILASGVSGLVTRGTILRATGHFTAELVIDGFVAALPSSRGTLSFEPAQDGIETRCDVIDLTGAPALFTGWENGMDSSASAEDSVRLAGLAGEAGELIGALKSQSTSTMTLLCAHSQQSEWLLSLSDVCPAGAIISAGDTVEIDPALVVVDIARFAHLARPDSPYHRPTPSCSR